MEPGKRKAQRRRPLSAAENPLTSLKISKVADGQLTGHAKKLRIGKGEYASAAIAYFAETGLDPTQERPQGLASVSAKVSQETRAVREQNVDIGNRLISILRGWERTLYGFLQQQQGGTLNYLERIEENILAHQVQVESSLLAPMVEQLFKVNLEAFITRGLTADLLVKSSNLPASSYEQQMELSTNGRDQQLATALREFIKTNSVAKPNLSPKPQVPAAPAKAPSTPTGAAPAAAAPPK